MKTIFKYPLAVADYQEIAMPKGSVVLTVQTQYGHPCIWVEIDPFADKEPRGFEVFGTGHKMYEDMGIERKYVGTFQMKGGDLVFHVYERNIL